MVPDKQQWLKERFRELRVNQTVPERLLWQLLRGRQLAGLKFVRQFRIGDFIVDFVCRAKRLVIEVDGNSHTDHGIQDLERQKFLELQGYRILRIANDEILEDLESVSFAIVREAGLDAEKWRDKI